MLWFIKLKVVVFIIFHMPPTEEIWTSAFEMFTEQVLALSSRFFFPFLIFLCQKEHFIFFWFLAP